MPAGGKGNNAYMPKQGRRGADDIDSRDSEFQKYENNTTTTRSTSVAGADAAKVNTGITFFRLKLTDSSNSGGRL